MGALAATAALAMLPATALADDGSSVIEFKLPDKQAADQLIKLGYDLGDGLDQSTPGQVKATIVVSPEQKAQLEAMGYPAVHTIMGPGDADALRAERNAQIKAENAAKAALSKPVASKRRSAAVGSVRAQRAEYYVDAAGLELSIEGTTTNPAYSCTVDNRGRERCNYVGDPLTAGWYDADGNLLGTVLMNDNADPDLSPDAYLYHVARVRVGDADATPPAYVQISAPNGDVATLATRKWVGNDPKTHPDGFLQDFNTHYVDPQEGYQRISDLAAEYPNIAEAVDLPNKTNGYQRKAQTIVGMSELYTGSTRTPEDDEQARAVVLTSNAWGQDGGNDIRVRLANPNANDEPLFVGVNGSMIRVYLATDASGAITSTAADVVDAINGNAAASALVTATKFRDSDGNGVVVPGSATSQLDDFLNAPESYPRGPQTVKML
ncbi:MAG TPA: hypothetical protein VFG79_13830, partial [Solirubrobacter sp.]|nr:hypothetical protein [Solirubrobacter sp.]